ncbi:hypothetical protein EYF80_054732 [Liparis tanakae]|uniref:Uncharacterized protein n=1 Tax=Liparis tanakae TaxID=230148 RepID=A0A4Z2F227_9TELE|nr:hypothetical protein EYF80_054732 [Liparis tanakae]
MRLASPKEIRKEIRKRIRQTVKPRRKKKMGLVVGKRTTRGNGCTWM